MVEVLISVKFETLKLLVSADDKVAAIFASNTFWAIF